MSDSVRLCTSIDARINNNLLYLSGVARKYFEPHMNYMLKEDETEGYKHLSIDKKAVHTENGQSRDKSNGFYPLEKKIKDGQIFALRLRPSSVSHLKLRDMVVIVPGVDTFAEVWIPEEFYEYRKGVLDGVDLGSILSQLDV